MAVRALATKRRISAIPWTILVLWVVIAGLHPSVSLAQNEDSNRLAKQFYDQGIKYYEAGDAKSAAEAFRAAYKLRPSWKILFNIGQAEASAGRYGIAVESFEQYLVEGRDEINPDRKDYVFKELQRLKQLVGTLVIHGPDGAAVFVDDMQRGELPEAKRTKVEAGSRKVVVSTDTGVLLREVVRISGGDEVVLEVKNVPVKAHPRLAKKSPPIPGPSQVAEKPPIPGPSPREGEGGGLATWGWVAVGVGGALLVSGAITGGMALSKQKDLEDKCPDKVCVDPNDRSLKDSADTLALATDILLPIGCAVAGTGIVLLVLGMSDDEQKGQASLSPILGAGFNGIAVQGRF